MLEILKKCYGKNIIIRRTKAKKGLPLYMARRNIYKASIQEISFVVVQVEGDGTFGAKAYEKQRQEYEAAYGANVAFYFANPAKRQVDTLVEHRVPFICDSQIYLPFLGLVLNDDYKEKRLVDAETMTPGTQVVFLYLLYKGSAPLHQSDIADSLGVSRMTVTRGVAQLLAMNLVAKNSDGKIERVADGFDYYKLAQPHLINPVQKKFYVAKDSKLANKVLAGENALSKYSMLACPEYDTLAIEKSEQSAFQEVDARWTTEEYALVEFWKYKPELFAINGNADPVSLALSLQENNDERVEMCVAEMLEEFEW